MDKVIDIKKVLEKTVVETEQKPEQAPCSAPKATNPILKKLAKFKNEKLSKKFDIKDLLR